MKDVINNKNDFEFLTTKAQSALSNTKNHFEIQKTHNMITQKEINDLAYKIVGCAIEVHKNLGPGLLESVYETCMIDELSNSGLKVQSQVYVPILYKEKDLGGKLKLDLLVNDLIIIELKAVDIMLPVYKAQVLSYLKLTGKPKGLLINFHCENIVEQMVPLVTVEFSKLPRS